jgi:16S rRNA G966 N2-methylase RsmD
MKLGIPYMGSKRAIAKNIVDFIKFDNPNAKYFYDLFGGGGSVSFQALNSFENVFYNEINTGVTKLLEKIRDDGITPEFYKWVSRETFNRYKNGNTWYGGYIKTCWSFGNNQKDYLFGSHIEEKKRLLHEIVVNKCNVSRNTFKEITGLYIEDNYLKRNKIQERRLEVGKLIKSLIGRFEFAQLEQLQQLIYIERLVHLERLEQLTQFAQLERLTILNQSYLDVEITTPINETVIYLDPPYINTTEYEYNINNEELMDYIKGSPYKIYVSGYEFDLKEVGCISKRCTLSATKNNKVVERLYCNR